MHAVEVFGGEAKFCLGDLQTGTRGIDFLRPGTGDQFLEVDLELIVAGLGLADFFAAITGFEALEIGVARGESRFGLFELFGEIKRFELDEQFALP